MHHTKTILLASLLLFPLSALAQTEVPNAFSDGTPALAAEVNENFTAVADGVNAQDVRIQNVESAIAGPEKMVFLGYAEGTSVLTSNFYGMNQVCKDAYSNPAARVVTNTAWTTLTNEGQLPLPSASAATWGNTSALQETTGVFVIKPSGVLQFSPSFPSFTGLFACMAPAG